MNPPITPETGRQEVCAGQWTDTAPFVLSSFALSEPTSALLVSILPKCSQIQSPPRASTRSRGQCTIPFYSLLSVWPPWPIGLRMKQNSFALITQPANNCHWLFCYPIHLHTSLHLPQGFISCLVILHADTGFRLLSGHPASASSVHTQPHWS